MTENKDHRFYSHFNRSAFLHVEICHQNSSSAEPFKMIKFWAGRTQDKKVVSSATHYLSYAEIRYLAFLILTFLEDEETWISYKGKVETNGRILSRVMKLNRKDEKYFLNVGVGPGVQQKSGLFQPDRQAAKESWQIISLVFTEEQLITFALETVAYLNALVAKEMFLIGG